MGGHGPHRLRHVQRVSVPVILHQVCRNQSVAVGGVHGPQRLRHALPPHVLALLRVVLNQRRGKKELISRRGDGMDRGRYLASHRITGVGHSPRHDVWRLGLYHELVHPANHAAHGVVGQRPDHCDAVPAFDVLLCGKDGIARLGPVDNLRRRSPFRQSVGPVLVVGPLRPYDGPPVASCHQHKAFPGRGRAVVRRHQLPVFHGIAQPLQLGYEPPEGLARLFLDRLSPPYRPPSLKFLHVFQDNHAGADGPSPAQDNPRQPPDIPVHQGRALCLGEVLAVRGEPRQPHRTAAALLHRVHVPHGGLQVPGVRVVGLVH